MANGTNNERIILGSGKVYIVAFTDEIPEDATIETEDNLLGLIQGGATLEYAPEFYTAEDDYGLAQKTILTKEEVTFKTGIITWCLKTLEKLCSTARVTDDSMKKVRTIKIGGLDHYAEKEWLIRFVQHDAMDGDTRITIMGSNKSGFSLAFAKDKETVVDAEFKAKALDNEGTKIIMTESLPGEDE